MLTYKNNLNQVSLYSGGGGIVTGGPAPVNPTPSYSFQGGHLVVNGGANASPTPVLYGDGNTVQLPDPTSYAANGYNATAYANGGNSEGVVSTSPDVPKVEAPTMTNLSYSENTGSAPSPTSTSAEGSEPPATTPPTTTPPENPTTDEASSHYDYLKDDVPESLRDIYNDEIVYQDQQNAQLVEDINGIRDTTIQGAGEIRDTAYGNAETQKETTYTYADKVLMETLGFNEEQYKYLLDSINASKETGLALAEDVRATLLSLATETRDQIYQAAEAARVREYEQAEIVRQRGIVDASNSYEQNKATYGANAEALASMGLTGGGYSDYLDAQAYAAQRGEVQAVNADAETAKRAARYAEDDKKMNADATYAANVKEAELNYSEQVGEVNATYEAALRDANLWKAEADNAANREHTDTIFAADTTYNTAIGEADASYAENVADANLQADIAIAEANAATEAAKHEAEQKLKEGLLTNEQAVAEYREEMFYYFLEKAGAGSYTVEQLDAIAAELDFTDTQKQMLNNALGEYNTAVEEEEAAKAKEEEENLAAVSSQNYQTISTNIKTDPDLYSEADIDKMVTDKLLTETDAALAKQLIKDTKTKFAKDDIDYYISSGDFNTLQSYLEEAYDGGNGIIDQNTYQDAYFRASLQNCANASGTSEILQVEADLKNLKDAGKISAADYDAAMKYMYASQGGLLSSSSYSATVSSKLSNSTGRITTTLKITIDGKTYSIVMKKNANAFGAGAIKIETADADTSKILTGIAGGGTPATNTLCMYNGQLYLYSGGWCKVKDTDGLYSKYNTLCGYQAKPTEPKHAEGGSSSSSGGSSTVTYPSDSEIAQKASAGTLTYNDVVKYNPGIRTRTEFMRGNNSDKQKYGTYQAYLKAMYEKYAK